MRAFVAVELEEEIKKSLSRVQTELRKLDEDIKWVHPQNMHLTLRFLGETVEQKIPLIIQLLKEAAGGKRPFTVEIKDIGGFPSLESPKIIWAGIEKGKEELTLLALAVEDTLVKLKFPKENRAFSAHFTLGRVRYIKNRQSFQEKIRQIQFRPLTQEVKSLILFKSTLTPKGPIYDKLGEACLKIN